MQIFPRKVLFQFQTSLAVPLCLGIGAVWKCQPLYFFSLCPAEPNSGSFRQPSALPSGESWAGGTCTDPFYPKEMSAWEPCLLHKSRQGYSDRLRRRQEGNVPSAEPFQDIPALRGCLCSQGTLACPASQAGLQTMTNPLPGETSQHLWSKSTSFNPLALVSV